MIFFFFFEDPPPPSGKTPVYSLERVRLYIIRKFFFKIRLSGPRGILVAPGEIDGHVHRVICFKRLPELLLRF